MTITWLCELDCILLHAPVVRPKLWNKKYDPTHV